MSRRKYELAGQKFGHLTVLEFDPERKDSKGRSFYKCRCDCGETLVVRQDNLTGGNSTQYTKCANSNKNSGLRNVVKTKYVGW